jgi:hypothetical protein
MSLSIELCERIAEQAHAGQVDYQGKPYIEHVRRVAQYVDPDAPWVRMAALLHDVIEDTADSLHPITAAHLLDQGVPGIVVCTVVLLTKRMHEPNADYYGRMMEEDPIAVLAREVKLADLADNTDPTRPYPEDKRERLTQKYAKAYVALKAGPSDGERRRRGAISPMAAPTGDALKKIEAKCRGVLTGPHRHAHGVGEQSLCCAILDIIEPGWWKRLDHPPTVWWMTRYTSLEKED